MLVGVCSFFNPCNYQQRLTNYNWFRRAVDRAGLELLTVELLFEGQNKSAFTGADVLTIRDGDIMWQKERLLQLGINRLLEDKPEAIIWLDADIIFERPDWLDNIKRSLDRFDCVQSFSELATYYSASSRVYPSTVANRTSPAMGGSWAARSDFWRKVSLYQHCVVGGGDHVMAQIFLDFENGPPDEWRYNTSTMQQFGPKMRQHILQWARDIWGKWRVGYVGDQPAYLLSHGREDRRQYNKRHTILTDFDPELDVKATPTGCWKWNTDSDIPAMVRNYFTSRKEDDL